MGDARAADQNYGFALRYERDHPESLLGRALLALDSDNAGGLPTAAASLKKLLDADPPAVAPAAGGRPPRAGPARDPGPGGHVRALAGRREEAGRGHRRPADRAAAAALATKEDEEGFALDRNNPELHLLRGKRLLVEGQPDAAIREMREAVKADPSRAQAYVDLARALMQKPEGARDAQEALSTAIRTMGESPRLMLMLGQVYFRQGRLDEAAAQYTKALADGKSQEPRCAAPARHRLPREEGLPQGHRAAHAGEPGVHRAILAHRRGPHRARPYLRGPGRPHPGRRDLPPGAGHRPHRRRRLLLLRPLPRRRPAHPGEGPLRRREVPGARAPRRARCRRPGPGPLSGSGHGRTGPGP